MAKNVYLYNVVSTDENLKYISIEGEYYLIYDAFVATSTTISANFTFKVNGATLTYTTQIDIEPNIPTNLFTDRNSTTTGQGTLYAGENNVSLMINGENGYTNPNISYDEISYVDETIGGVLTRIYTKLTKNVDCTENISFCFLLERYNIHHLTMFMIL